MPYAGINVQSVMEEPNVEAVVVRPQPKTNKFDAMRRLEMISGMMEELERAVNDAKIGNGQYWVEAYDNLYNALNVCKNIEKNIV